MTATVKPWNQFPAAVSVVEADKLLLVDVSDTTEGADGTMKVSSVGTVATVFAAYIAEAETAENNATTQANAAAASAAAAAAIVNINAVQTFTNPLRQAVRVRTTAGASGGGAQVPNNANVELGLDNFYLDFTIALDDWTPAALLRIAQKYVDLSNRLVLYVNTNGTIGFFAAVGGVTIIAVDSTVATGAADGSVVNGGIAIVRPTALAAGSATFYINNVQLGSAVAIPAAAPVSLNVAAPWVVFGGSAPLSGREAADFYRFRIMNRAPSAPEVLAMRNGPAFSDVGARQVPQYLSNFSAGLHDWAVTGGSGAGQVNTGNIDADADGAGVPPSNDWQKAVRSGSSGILGFYGNNDTIRPPSTAIGRRVYAEAEIYIPAGSPITHITARFESNNVTNSPETRTIAAVTAGQVNKIVFGGVLPTVVSGLLYSIYLTATNSVGVAATVADGTAMYLKNVSWKYSGIILDLDAENAQSNNGQVFDATGNGSHMLLPAAGATIIGRPTSRSQQVRWTNTWTGTHELQYIGGVNQAILPANAFIESIVGRVTGATPHDIIVGDGSDADRFVTITTGLAAGTVNFTLASRTTDGTNLKLTVDPDTNCTMSIAWTITYRTLE